MSWGDIKHPHRRTPAVHCKDCGIELNDTNRHFKKANFTLPTNRCRECWNKYQCEYTKERRVENEEFRNKLSAHTRKSTLKAKYGITEEQYQEMHRIQGGVCAICKFPCSSGDKLSVDHCHKTGEIRGLLCKSCNIAIAAVDESEDVIYSMLDYLRQHNDKATVQIRQPRLVDNRKKEGE